MRGGARRCEDKCEEVRGGARISVMMIASRQCRSIYMQSFWNAGLDVKFRKKDRRAICFKDIVC